MLADNFLLRETRFVVILSGLQNVAILSREASLVDGTMRLFRHKVLTILEERCRHLSPLTGCWAKLEAD